MGIPQLTRHMQPHGTKIVLPQQVASSGGANSAIIDGPSLAYHCFYVCLSRRSGARNALEATPPYRELGEAAISWLQQIEQYGLKVKAIYFDGLLPDSKKVVRLSRLQNYANQLVTFKSSNREDLPPRSKNVWPRRPDILSPPVSSTRLKSLPAPPFLVPAIIEAILSSSFGLVSSVIPGEADAYCAHSARGLGGTIFTSDSDLLVHNLGDAGKVVLFRDLENIHLPSKGKCLKAQEYHPAAIAAKFGLPDLVTMAFYMAEDNHRSLTEDIRLARGKRPASPDFDAFAEQYASLPILSTFLSTKTAPALHKILLGLDPRISELVHQVQKFGEEPSLVTSGSASLDMYLPFLLDDPTRTSAWRAGASVRSLAYSLLRLLNPRISSIEEFERKGTRISNTSLVLLQLDEIADSAKQLNILLQAALLECGPNISLSNRWRAVGARLICQANIDSEKSPPSSADLAQLIAGTRNGPLTWSLIHASVQMQASLYSLRLLDQILQVVIACLQHEQHEQSSSDCRTSLEDLSRLVRELPNLADLLDTEHADEGTGMAESIAAAIFQSLGITESNEHAVAESKKKRKKKGEHTNERQPPDSAWRTNNMFGSLS